MRAIALLEASLSKRVSFAGCKGEVLFKAAFYQLMQAKEFHAYAKGTRRTILGNASLPKLKRLILFSAFCSYRLTAMGCRCLRAIREKGIL
jgi:hypothetical protein